MRASDVMTTRVVTVLPGTSVREVARMLLSNRISAVSVVDTGDHVLGMLSEGACFPLISLALPSSPHLTLPAMRSIVAGAALLTLGVVRGCPFTSRMSLWGWIVLTDLSAATLAFLGLASQPSDSWLPVAGASRSARDH